MTRLPNDGYVDGGGRGKEDSMDIRQSNEILGPLEAREYATCRCGRVCVVEAMTTIGEERLCPWCAMDGED